MNILKSTSQLGQKTNASIYMWHPNSGLNLDLLRLLEHIVLKLLIRDKTNFTSKVN